MNASVPKFVLICVFAGAMTIALPAGAQESRAAIFGHVGGAGVGHNDSEMGKAPLFGGGLAIYVTPRLAIDVDYHTARISNVFDRDHHDFTQQTFTASLLFRSSPAARAHFLGGGGLAVQRAHTERTDPTLGLIEETDSVRLLHARAGVEWDLSRRLVLRTEGLFWMGGGLDWVTGGRVAIGYRF
jgi:hypothetical protein